MTVTNLPANLLTIYGRKPVLEALQDTSIEFHKVHFADSNKPSGIIKDIKDLCAQRGIEIATHDKLALSRISKNKKQDQGVAADILATNFCDAEDFFNAHDHYKVIALENVTNPQNVGMIIRAACAGGVDGILIPKKGCAKLDALVIKASAGTLFRAPILRCEQMTAGLVSAKANGACVFGLALQDSQPINSAHKQQKEVYVLGNETDGMSPAARKLCDELLFIPMQNGIESLNVAITAALIAFMR
ncbi:RNA methyltransferase [Aurantivibrio plasticivorans]